MKEKGNAPSIKLTHWPGETYFGEFESSGWATAPGALPIPLQAEYGKGQFPIAAEINDETLRKPPNKSGIKFQYNSDYGAPWNARIAYSNYLLGLKRPFVSRVYLKDERALEP